MQSDGGLVEGHRFSGLKSILSGPAGGVVGYSRTCYNDNNLIPLIGFDMGGTSTDVSRFGEGKLEHVFETTTAGIVIQSPQLNVNTVAPAVVRDYFGKMGSSEWDQTLQLRILDLLPTVKVAR
ncbi:ANL_collapsed_G0053040.mRNA.1.CDS.1 [Saccharomyces cerevisiae]|nr:ANL_collapsed_G0053040.mRNA.1.CDS.1 [Saccharomyces cerevisiae]